MMPMEPDQFSIYNTTIRRDAAGRYRINDLHQAAVASGVTKDIRPNEFMSLKSTQEFIEVIEAENSRLPGFSVTEKIKDLAPVNIVKGFDGDQGTYVCKELVYEYAMWVSTVFRLHVIRTFDAVVQAQLKAKDAKYDRLYDKYDREDLNHVCDSMIMQQQIRSLESAVQELRSDLDALRVDRDAYHHCLVACEHEMGEQKQEIADLRLDLNIWKPKSLQ